MQVCEGSDRYIAPQLYCLLLAGARYHHARSNPTHPAAFICCTITCDTLITNVCDATDRTEQGATAIGSNK